LKSGGQFDEPIRVLPEKIRHHIGTSPNTGKRKINPKNDGLKCEIL
jgi:hypothetical protein